MITLLIFIVVLAILVLSHEFGHFVVARINRIKVEEFGFGFPPRIVGIRRMLQGDKKSWHIVWGNKKVEHEVEASEHVPGTVYSLNWLPLGGFVKIKGEDAESAEAQDIDSFVVKKAWQKAAVLIAGVVMNVLVAVLLLSVGFMVGMPQAVDDAPDPSRLQNVHLEILETLPGTPAAQAGIEPGDKVLQVGTLVSPNTRAFRAYIQAHPGAVPITIERDGQVVVKQVQPQFDKATGKNLIGVAIGDMGVLRYPWYQALYEGTIATGLYLKAIVVAFYALIIGLFKGAGIAADVSGPVGVAVMTGQAARLGFTYLLQFTAMLSLNLAVLNILPIPALDGGRLLFVIIAKIIRRPVTPKVEQLIHTVGFALLLLLVLVVTVKDVGTFKGSIVHFFKSL